MGIMNTWQGLVQTLDKGKASIFNLIASCLWSVLKSNGELLQVIKRIAIEIELYSRAKSSFTVLIKKCKNNILI
jgi:hypothetical protein